MINYDITLWIISPHQLKTYAKMISEVEVFEHVNDIMSSIFIFFAKMVQDPYFNECLMMKSLFIPAKKFKYIEHHFKIITI
jgi:hypothetical protein